jgi:hypothetical protein
MEVYVQKTEMTTIKFDPAEYGIVIEKQLIYLVPKDRNLPSYFIQPPNGENKWSYLFNSIYSVNGPKYIINMPMIETILEAFKLSTKDLMPAYDE